MGLIKKILNGKARHFKVYRKCSECEDTSVKIVTSKSGRDLKALGKENAKKEIATINNDVVFCFNDNYQHVVLKNIHNYTNVVFWIC